MQDYIDFYFNNLIKNKNISLKAKAMYSYILSESETAVFHIDDMKRELKEGSSAIYSAIKELEDNGLLVRKQVNNYGIYGGMNYKLTLGD